MLWASVRTRLRLGPSKRELIEANRRLRDSMLGMIGSNGRLRNEMELLTCRAADLKLKLSRAWEAEQHAIKGRLDSEARHGHTLKIYLETLRQLRILRSDYERLSRTLLQVTQERDSLTRRHYQLFGAKRDDGTKEYKN